MDCKLQMICGIVGNMAAIEKHYTVREVAQLWGLSTLTIRKQFTNESGVLKLGEGERKGKRPYITMLIPESVVQKFHQRVRNK